MTTMRSRCHETSDPNGASRRGYCPCQPTGTAQGHRACGSVPAISPRFIRRRLTVSLASWPNPYFLLAYAVLVPSSLALLALRRHPKWACHLLAWGGLAVLLIAMLLLPDSWLPYIALLLLFLSAMLVTGGEWVVAI